MPTSFKSSRAASSRRLRKLLLATWLLVALQVLYSKFSRTHPSIAQDRSSTTYMDDGERQMWSWGGSNDYDEYPSSGVIFAEAAKKKKKEKSEVVVISVNNPSPKGHGHGYPIYIPTCGGGGGMGGFGRRRKREIESFSLLQANTRNKY